MNREWIISIAVVILLFFAFCRKKSENNIINDYKYEYFPLQTGNWIIYDVDSTDYNDVSSPPIITKGVYQIKEIVESSFIDAENRVVYRIERWRKNQGDSIWSPVDACYAYGTSVTAEKVEDNLRFIKLVFPIAKDKKWSGNTYINATEDLAWYGGWEYMYKEIYQPKSIGNFNFDSTLTVEEVNDTVADLSKMKFSQAIYAKNVGMVYRKIMKLQTQQLVNKPWVEKGERGFIIEMKVNDYKK